MAMIRSGTAGQYARDAIVLDLGDLRRQAEAILREAREASERVVDEARAERERLVQGASEEGRTSGQEAGFAQGLEEGRAQGRAEALEAQQERLEALLSGWTSALDAFEQSRDAMLGELRRDALTLALEIGARVARRAVSLDPDVAAASLEAALTLVGARSALTIAIHPEDQDVVGEALPALMERLARGAHASVTHDESLTRGSCVLHSESGEIDASIETQIERLIDAVRPPGAEESPA